MRTALRLAVGTGALATVALSASPALAVCDPYSNGCVSPERVEREQPDSGVLSGRSVVDADAASPTTLPFTGGELVLVATLGAAAVGGGTALVVAGRRRTATR